MKCRHCGAELSLTLIDLGSSPPSNAYLTEVTMCQPEKWLPLKVLVCESCWLVQAEAYSRAAELFNGEYAYFSSYSDQWLAHAEEYVTTMVERFGLTGNSHIVEVASNDGYLLQFVKEMGIPCLGIEPTTGTASVARLKGIEVVGDFFCVSLAEKLVAQGKQADLMVANNVLAHVSDINDFTRAFSILLKAYGVATFEFPHLMELIENKQFDTIYHEHFSYLSFSTVCHVFKGSGLSVFDVEEIGTHGGSLRVFAQRADTGRQPVSPKVAVLLGREMAADMYDRSYYLGFQEHANKIKNDLLFFLLDAKRRGKSVVAYGAAAKGNTLLNYSGVRPDLIPFVVDRNPNKQGKYMPGSRIPIVDENRLRDERPDYVLILPWNIKVEVMHQLEYVKATGGRFVTAVPELELV